MAEYGRGKASSGIEDSRTVKSKEEDTMLNYAEEKL